MGTEQATGGVSLDELAYVIDVDTNLRENITDIEPYLDDSVGGSEKVHRPLKQPVLLTVFNIVSNP